MTCDDTYWLPSSFFNPILQPYQNHLISLCFPVFVPLMPYFSLFLNDTIHDVAFLGDPTDVYVVPEKASHAAKAAYGSGLRNFGLDMLVNLFSNGKYMNKNTVPVGKFISNGSTNEMDENRQTVHLTNGLTKEHGANHALAKHIQHWRSIIEYEAGTTGRPLSLTLPLFVCIRSTHNNHSLSHSCSPFISSIYFIYSSRLFVSLTYLTHTLYDNLPHFSVCFCRSHHWHRICTFQHLQQLFLWWFIVFWY